MTTDLDDLQKRLKDLQNEILPPVVAESEKADIQSGSSDASKGYELLGTPIVCGALGLGLDKLFSTGPAFFLGLAFLGVCAAFWSIFKSERNIVTPLDQKRLQQGQKTAMKAAISEENSDN